ncbi:MAG: insulinase family protein [Lachnospiraceae bacterium]|nr:insulinase family protein [Lachnospiraceae bacterium]
MEKKQDLTRLLAYEVLSHEYLPDVDSDSWLLRHKKTGARVALLPKDDNNKVFYIAFRTPPEDSTGVAHIIEHTVLCGSRDFPVKDPFIELVKGSLNTFLNAMTYPDKTVYPVASCNEQDFKNLMHVYLDAVFYPNIYQEQNIFRQEGWHYEAESADSEITVNGVVYNEMKGALSSPEDILGRQINAALYPHTTYAFESGGDPVNIPDLTYEDYLDFHRRYYHPSNSYIYLYGDMDMEERLTWIDEHYLSNFDRLDIDSSIRLEPAFEKPVEAECAYSILPGEDPAGKAFLSWNVAALPDSLDAGLNMALKILNYALCDSEGAPVRKALRDRGLGEDVLTSFEPGIRQPSYSIVSKYVDPARKDEFVGVIRKTLEKIAAEGIAPRALEAGINLYEFRYREADYGSYPKGLFYGLGALDSWLYDDEKPFIGLQIGDFFDALRKKAGEGYFESLIRTCLLDNPHCAVVVLNPEQGLSDRLDEELRARMKEFAQKCSPAQRQAIVDKLAALRAWQQTPDSEENIRKIPMLQREDLTRQAARLCNEVREIGVPEKIRLGAEGQGPLEVENPPKKFTAVTHPVSTNHIDYMTFLFDVSGLSEEHIRHLGIFRTLFSVLDTASHDYAALGHEINISTGGLSSVVTSYNWYGAKEEMPAAVTDREAETPFRLTYEVTVRALHKNLHAALRLLREILLSTNYNMPTRILEVLEEERAGMRAGMASAGHATAAQRAMSYLSRPAALMDLISGLSSYEMLDRTCAGLKNMEESVELCSLLQEMAVAIFTVDNMTFDCTASPEDIPEILAGVQDLATSLMNGNGVVHPDHSPDPELCKSCTLACPSRPQAAQALFATRAGRPPQAAAFTGLETVEKKHSFLPELVKKNEGLTTAGQVQFVCRAGHFDTRVRKSTGAFRVLRVLLGYDYLWNRVRVEGGAYGCMSSFLRDGLAYMVSYRDPHLNKTIGTFEGTPAFMRSFDADERTMTKYIIGAVSALDQPMTPCIYGRYSLNAYLMGLTDADLQRERDEVLDAGVEEIRALADYLDDILADQCICVVGSDAKLRENSALFREIRSLV